MANNVNLSFPSAYYQQFIDKNGKPLVGGKLYTYIAGSSTPVKTYKTIGGGTESTNTNTNPIILDIAGMANIVISRDIAYRFVLCDKNDVKIGEWDNITAGGSGGYLPETIVVRVDGTEHHITSTASFDGDNKLIFTIDIDQDILDRISNIEDGLETLSTYIGQKKNIQSPYTSNGTATKTIKKVTQDANGNIAIEYQDISFPQQAPNVNIESPNGTIDVESEVVGNTKTFKIDVKSSLVPYSITQESIQISSNWITQYSYTLLNYVLDDVKTNDIDFYRPFPNSSIRGWQLKKDHIYILAFNGIVTGTGNTNRFIPGRIWTGGSNSVAQVWRFNIDDTILASSSVSGSAILCPDSDIPDFIVNMRYDENLSNQAIPSFYWNKIELVDITSIIGNSGGGGGAEYEAGEAIEIENDEISVKYGAGLEVDENNNLKVKIGDGLKFDEDTLSVEVNTDVEEVVEVVKKLSEDLDKKITTTFPFAQITTMGDYAAFGVTNTNRMVGQLFGVPITTELRENDTLVCVNALQNYNGNVTLGIFEFDFEANNGQGSTYWLADTGVVQIQAGENEFPIKHILHDVNRPKIELLSSRLYYACICVDGAAPTSGLFLASSPNYGATYNAMPLYTMKVSNLNIDWSTGSLSGTWFEGHNEDNTIPRLFMMLRNCGEESGGGGDDPQPTPTEPFTDIGSFSLYHSNRINNVFGNVIPNDLEGAVFQKVIPTTDVDIIGFDYVDYRGSNYTEGSWAVVLDNTLTAIKTISDGSWVQTTDEQLPNTAYYIHKFRFTTPLHLTASSIYWFPAQMYTIKASNYTDGGRNWLVQYTSPNVARDMQLVKSLWNVNDLINSNGNGEFKSAQRGVYLKLYDNDNHSWVI